MANTTQFSIANAPQLRCMTNQYNITTCGHCDACCVTQILNQTKEWFTRCGEASQRRFTMGLMSRIDCRKTYSYLMMLLTPLSGKDYTYTRSRSNPSLKTDYSTSPSDRALKKPFVIKSINNTWQWFSSANEWTQTRFLLALLQWCDTRLLHILNNQCRALHKWKVEGDDNSTDEDDHSEYITHKTSNTKWTRARSRGSAKSKSPDIYTSTQIRPSTATSTRSVDSSRLSEPVLITTCQSWTDKAKESDAISGHTKSYVRHSSSRSSSITSIITHYDKDEDDDNYISNDGESSDEDIPYNAANDTSGARPYIDLIKCLPVYISKKILGMLDRVHLANCLCVSRHWRMLVEQVQSDIILQQEVWEEIMLMKGSSTRGCNTKYACYASIPVPKLIEGTQQIELKEERDSSTPHLYDIRNLKNAYSGVATVDVVMDERNIFCDAYNLIVAADQFDKHRVVHFDGGQYIVTGSVDRKIKLINAQDGRLIRVMPGHAGSIKALHMCEEEAYLLSGGYDTTIRCWSLDTGTFIKILRGHQGTITCIDVFNNIPVSGSRDKQVKIWNIFTGRCRRTFKHRHVILDVKIIDDTVASCCEGGRVKVWDVTSGKLIKSLKGHIGPVNCLKMDAYHIVSGGADGYAFLWSAIGTFKGCLGAFRHPNAVLSVDIHFCRIITGSEDGKIRIWNMINGDCLRVMRGNSKSDPITDLFTRDDRLITNTMRNVFNYTFEPVEWDYTATSAKVKVETAAVCQDDKPREKLPPSYIRVMRNRSFSTNNDRVHSNTTIPGKYGLHGRPLTANTLHPRSRPNSSKLNLPARQTPEPELSNLQNGGNDNITGTVRPKSSPAKLSRKKVAESEGVNSITEYHDCRGRAFYNTASALRPSTAPVVKLSIRIKNTSDQSIDENVKIEKDQATLPGDTVKHRPSTAPVRRSAIKSSRKDQLDNKTDANSSNGDYQIKSFEKVTTKLRPSTAPVLKSAIKSSRKDQLDKTTDTNSSNEDDQIKSFEKVTTKLRPSTAPVIRFADTIISDMHVEPRIIGRVKSANAAIERSQSKSPNYMSKMMFKPGNPYVNENQNLRRQKRIVSVSSTHSAQSINMNEFNSFTHSNLNLRTYEEHLAYTTKLMKINRMPSKFKQSNTAVS